MFLPTVHATATCTFASDSVHDKGVLHNKYGHIAKPCWSVFLKLNKSVSSSDVVQNDQRAARNIMVIAKTPEDRLTTFKHRQQHQNHIH
eukprot:8505795-Heterocapsa_arctica.AAC.1